MTTLSTPDLWIEQWLSFGRFATFVEATGGSRSRALKLYEWNAQLSAAFLHDLGHLEVGLRNACDRKLDAARDPEEVHWTEPRSVHFLFPPTSTSPQGSGRARDRNSLPRHAVERARSSVAGSPASEVIPGKVVAELTFGFWTYLVSDLHEKTIWVPYLHKVFPAGIDRKKLSGTFTSLRDFRNRVAHHENILANPESKRRQLVSVAKLISPDLHTHILTHSQISTILEQRP